MATTKLIKNIENLRLNLKHLLEDFVITKYIFSISNFNEGVKSLITVLLLVGINYNKVHSWLFKILVCVAKAIYFFTVFF